jgi:large subunit ribosomal protein L21
MKAIIKVGGKQYIVAEKQTLLVDKLGDEAKTFDVEPLMVIDGDSTKVGAPTVKGVKVSVKVIDPVVAGEKLKIIRFKAKKRVKTLTGHRQKYSKIEISKIT